MEPPSGSVSIPRERLPPYYRYSMKMYSYPLVAGLTLLAVAQPAFARAFRVNMIPNGNVFGCANCHLSPAGGGPRNAFGNDVYAVVLGPSSTAFWSKVYNKDSDGDGFTNGQELGDPNGTGNPAPGAQVTNPGDASSHPVVVVNQPPSVNVTSPVEGAVLTEPFNGLLSASASDSDGSVAQVEFFLNGISAGIVTTPPYEVGAAGLAAGAYTLTATATDDKAATKTSTAIHFTVNAAPSVSLTSPASGSTFITPADITLSADAADTDGAISQVEFFEGAHSLGAVSNPPFTLVWSNAPAGSFNLTAAATDNQGAKTVSEIVLITVRVPAVALRLEPIELTSTNVILTWTGGAGPSVIQVNTNLLLNVWTPVATTTNRTASIPRGIQQAFYRILDTGATP